MKANREEIKVLIKLAPNVDEADKVINENYDFKSIREKIAFLQGMFDVEIVHKHDATDTSKEESDKMDYYAMLSTIINKK